MYICVYIYMCVYMYVYIYVYIYIYIYIYINNLYNRLKENKNKETKVFLKIEQNSANIGTANIGTRREKTTSQ